MSLDKQIHIYSFDTSAFYTDGEREQEKIINDLTYHKSDLKSERDILNDLVSNIISAEKAEKMYRALYHIAKDESVVLGGQKRIDEIKVELKQANSDISNAKKSLVSLLNGHNAERELRPEYVIDKNIISVFESMLTRTLGMETGGLYDDFMVVRTFYFEVIRDLIMNGFTYNGNKYICYTASAGQIRTKKTVFIKEKAWKKYQNTLMCGLSVDRINAQGGININKYLAYLALCNSATDPWPQFDIEKSIVVDDMETLVHGMVDFIDHKTYRMERREMDVPITHTDGCGMVLPSVSKKNFMVRLPWVKGLLASFPFDKFIREANKKEPNCNHGIIRDIYGVEHDVLAEGIQVIFTKSQFKMWRYYTSWEEYKQLFQEYSCNAGKCNEERDYIPNAKLNYQMLQTLTDINDEELRALAERSIDRITRIASDRATMLDAFGAAEWDDDQNDFQKCLSLYPELLSDPYTKEVLKQIKKKLVTDARAGKLSLKGKYAFIIPDLYAFCEWLFLGDKNPVGLLKDGEVSCRLYQDSDKLDCLRSPHLYREHAVRRNVVKGEIRRWYTPIAVYTSCHDLISKMLQFDCDGDTALVCAEPLLISIAERNMQGIVPLYYEMAKADAVEISNAAIYDGMRAAWRYGNIGRISNDITKLWNSENPDIDMVKILTCENNFSIDAAKTLYMPERPNSINSALKNATQVKVPHFFQYAKAKETEQTAPINNSVVNRLESIVPNKRMCFSAQNIGKLRYRNMLRKKRGSAVTIEPSVVSLYDEIASQYRFQISAFEDEDNLGYVRTSTLKEFEQFDIPMEDICDMLTTHLFRDKPNKRKGLFWLCFGDIILQNLQRNIPTNSIQCRKCGNRFVPKTPNQKICKECSAYKPIGIVRKSCCDCGKIFEVSAKGIKKIRCDDCQQEYRKQLDRERKGQKAA